MRSAGEDDIRRAIRDAAPADEPEKGGSRDLRLAKKPLNDSGNAERFRHRHGRNLLSVREIGRHYWTGSHWTAGSGDKEWALNAQKTAAAMMLREAFELEAALNDEDAKSAPKRMHDFRAWALLSGNAPRLDAMQRVAEPHLEIRIDQLDADPFVFNVQNGTLELGTKNDPLEVRMRRHSRHDRITRIAPIGYDPEASCPLFRAFLDQIIPDRDVQDWLQRWFGYGLTGDFSEHKFAVHYGEGANGKGTLAKLIQWLLGDYGATVQFQSFVDAGMRRGGEPSPDLAKLTGVRGVFASEGKKGARLDDGLVKQVTGGDPATVRKLNRDFFDLAPTFKINLIANNKPDIRDDTHGMWRRVVLVPYLVIVREDQVDKNLGDKLRAEGPGVLNWALDGWRGWRERGLTAPQAILAATAEYRSESDRIGQFIETATLPDRDGMIPASEMLACYEAWCHAMDYKPVSQTKLGKELSRRGVMPMKHGITYRIGRKWNPDAIDWDWQPPMR